MLDRDLVLVSADATAVGVGERIIGIGLLLIPR
jgi:hypothetical protein